MFWVYNARKMRTHLLWNRCVLTQPTAYKFAVRLMKEIFWQGTPVRSVRNFMQRWVKFLKVEWNLASHCLAWDRGNPTVEFLGTKRTPNPQRSHQFSFNCPEVTSFWEISQERVFYWKLKGNRSIIFLTRVRYRKRNFVISFWENKFL